MADNMVQWFNNAELINYIEDENIIVVPPPIGEDDGNVYLIYETN